MAELAANHCNPNRLAIRDPVTRAQNIGPKPGPWHLSKESNKFKAAHPAGPVPIFSTDKRKQPVTTSQPDSKRIKGYSGESKSPRVHQQQQQQIVSFGSRVQQLGSASGPSSAQTSQVKVVSNETITQSGSKQIKGYYVGNAGPRVLPHQQLRPAGPSSAQTSQVKVVSSETINQSSPKQIKGYYVGNAGPRTFQQSQPGSSGHSSAQTSQVKVSNETINQSGLKQIKGYYVGNVGPRVLQQAQLESAGPSSSHIKVSTETSNQSNAKLVKGYTGENVGPRIFQQKQLDLAGPRIFQQQQQSAGPSSALASQAKQVTSETVQTMQAMPETRESGPESQPVQKLRQFFDYSRFWQNLPEDRRRELMDRQATCQRMMLLLTNFSDEQHNRYEMYRRSKFSKTIIKRLISQATGQVINEKIAIAIAGIAKVFVGQIVEAGLDYMDELHQSGPLQPKHIREAVRRIRVNTTPGRYLTYWDSETAEAGSES